MRQTGKSLQSEKCKQVAGGLGKPLGKSPAPHRIRFPRDLDRSFPSWPGSGCFGTALGVCCPQLRGHAPSNCKTPDRYRETGLIAARPSAGQGRAFARYARPPLQPTPMRLLIPVRFSGSAECEQIARRPESASKGLCERGGLGGLWVVVRAVCPSARKCSPPVMVKGEGGGWDAPPAPFHACPRPRLSLAAAARLFSSRRTPPSHKGISLSHLPLTRATIARLFSSRHLEVSQKTTAPPHHVCVVLGRLVAPARKQFASAAWRKTVPLFSLLYLPSVC